MTMKPKKKNRAEAVGHLDHIRYCQVCGGHCHKADMKRGMCPACRMDEEKGIEDDKV